MVMPNETTCVYSDKWWYGGGVFASCKFAGSEGVQTGLEHTVANTYLELIWFCTYIMHYQSTNRLQTNYPQHPRL